MNKRVATINISLNNIEITKQEEMTQADTNTNYIELNFDSTIELNDWDLNVMFKTPYPAEVLVDTYKNISNKKEILIPNLALKRNGNLIIELSLQQNDKLITINKHIELTIKRTINGTFLSANLGDYTQGNITDKLKAIQELLKQTDVKINEYNTNADLKTKNFNDNALETGKEYVNAVKTEGDTWVIAIQHEGELQEGNLQQSYNEKIQGLDNLITQYIIDNEGKFKGPKGDIGEVGPIGPQGIQGEQGVPGERGLPGTTDFNQLENKPNLSLYQLKQDNTLKTTSKNIVEAINELLDKITVLENK